MIMPNTMRSFQKIARGFFPAFAALLLGHGVATAQDQEALAASRPNVVFLYVDDLGWKDAGFTGSPYFDTPHIDRLAGEGMVFTSAYANAPNCAPSRAALLSGQYAPRTGVYTVRTPERGQARFRKIVPIPNRRTLDEDIVTLAEVLQEAGYRTASIGKWHLGNPPEQGPEAQGFDVNVGGYEASNPNYFGGYFAPWQNPHLDAEVPPGTYLTDHLTDKALTFMEQSQEQPFFLYMTFYNVHTPWEAPDSLVEKYSGREKGDSGQIDPRYAAMVETVDRNVGRILAHLDAAGLREETIVVFTSDNGGHVRVTSHEPLRGSKGTLYEGGIRVPMAVRWPGAVEPGSRTDTPVIGTDFFPTLLEMTGTPAPEDKVLDGESLVPLLEGKSGALPGRPIFWHFPAYLEAYTEEQGRWRTTPAGGVRKGKWKLLEFFEDGRTELYNLEEDIGESNNLAAERPEKAEELLGVLREWRVSTGAPVPITPNPKYEPTAQN